MTVDFSRTLDMRQHPSGNVQDALAKRMPPMTQDGKLLTPKQIRARARRRAKRSRVMSDQELEYLYKKPVEEWDLEELAHGRPRNSQGNFKGPKPSWISINVHERAMELYTQAIKTGMKVMTADVLGVMNDLINSDDTDDRGKPIVPASVKADLSKFLLEHVVGKPTQRIENDVSVKLQGILGQVMVNPNQLSPQGALHNQYQLGHMPGVTMELSDGKDTDDQEDLDFS